MSLVISGNWWVWYRLFRYCLICCFYLRWLETLWQTNFGKWRLIVMETLYTYHFDCKSQKIILSWSMWLPEKSVKICLPRTCCQPVHILLASRQGTFLSHLVNPGKQMCLLFPTGLHTSRAALQQLKPSCAASCAAGSGGSRDGVCTLMCTWKSY